MNREISLRWVRFGCGYSRQEFGLGINAIAFKHMLSIQLMVGPFYVFVEFDR